MNAKNQCLSTQLPSEEAALSIKSKSPRRCSFVGSGLLHLAICTLLMCASASADIVTVNGQSGPWLWVNGGLNTAFQYGVNDQLAPTTITTIGGINLSAGQTVTLTYRTGTVDTASNNNPPGFTDANGYLGGSNPGLSPNPNGTFPSHYMNESFASPKYIGELVGTFANSAGQIVGTPIAIGDGPSSFTVPGGATRLQLGVNDNGFGDNQGSWNIEVTSVPEPSVAALLGIGVMAVASARRKVR